MTGARVIVTGGASGLGASVVRLLRRQEALPFVLDMRQPEDRTAPHAIVDVASAEQVSRAVDDAAAHLGGIDAVVTAAGIDRCGPLLDVAADDWNAVIGVNLVGTANVIRSALPYLIGSGGRIVTISSILAIRTAGDASAYCASKAGVIGLSRALAIELKGRVGVTVLIPGGMDTSFFDGRPAQYVPPPDAALCQPDDVARVVLTALDSPRGCELREVIVAPATEPGWP